MGSAYPKDSYPLLKYPSSSEFSTNELSLPSTPYQGQYFDSPHLEDQATVLTPPGSNSTILFRRPVDDCHDSSLVTDGPLQRNPVRTKRDHEDSPQSPFRRVLSLVTDWWVIEIICSTLSIVSLLAILWILRWQHNRPLPEWWFGITLNAVVSALVTLAKALMAASVAACLGQLKWTQFNQQNGISLVELESVDQASRGAWGSIKLLGNPKSRYVVSYHTYFSN